MAESSSRISPERARTATYTIPPAVTESALVAFCYTVVELLVLLGVVTDPTTEGVGDSAQALRYEKPKE